MFSNFLLENCAIYVIIWKKYFRAWQDTVDIMVHAHCMLDS